MPAGLLRLCLVSLFTIKHTGTNIQKISNDRNVVEIGPKFRRKREYINQQTAGFLQLYFCLIKNYYLRHITDTLSAIQNPTKINFQTFQSFDFDAILILDIENFNETGYFKRFVKILDCNTLSRNQFTGHVIFPDDILPLQHFVKSIQNTKSHVIDNAEMVHRNRIADVCRYSERHFSFW